MLWKNLDHTQHALFSHLTSWIQKAQPTSTNVHWMLEPHIFCSQSVSHMCLLGCMVDGNPRQNREQTRKRERKRALVSKSGVSLSLSLKIIRFIWSPHLIYLLWTIYIYIYVTRYCKEGKFPTYHKLTHHITKFTKYSQLQSAMYYY